MKVVLVVLVVLAVGVLAAMNWFVNMPGRSFRGARPPLDTADLDLQRRLRAHIQEIAGRIGGRSVYAYAELQAAADYIDRTLSENGYSVRRQAFTAMGREVHNLEVELSGTDRRDEIVVVGAHYDTAGTNPGANDNGSGTAAVLELARMFRQASCGRTVRFVLFVNEEPPFFQTSEMGSLVYARRCKERNEKVTAMLSLETIAYYSDEPRSQRYPVPFHPGLPNTANFIGFVGNPDSAKLLRQVMRTFRRHATVPSEGAAAPGSIPGVGWSDHWSFWQAGYPAVMVTDTALYRYEHYHTQQDTPDKLDYDSMTRVVRGIEHVIRDLAQAR